MTPDEQIAEWRAKGLVLNVGPGGSAPGVVPAPAPTPAPNTVRPAPDLPPPAPRVVVVLDVPVRLASEANARGTLRAKIGRKAAVKAAVRAALALAAPPPLPVRVTLTRVGGKRLDSDNAARACKAVRDVVAEWLGLDDADSRVRWVVRQRAGWAAGVRIRVETRGT